MFKNLSLQGKLIGAFCFMGVLVLLVAIIGWGGTARLSSNIQVFSEKTFPSTTSLWKVNEAQSRVMAAENLLISTIITNDRRQKELGNITKAMQDVKDGWAAYEKLQRDPEEDKLYNNVKREWDKWTNASQDFLQLHSKYIAYGVANPTKVQIQLLQQGQNNNPEFSTAQAAVKVVEEMINFNDTQLDPSFNSATEKLLELLAYNSKLADEAQNRANIDVKVSNLSILIGLLFGPLTAISFGIVLSRSIATKVRELVKVSHAIASSKSPGSTADASRDEIGKLQTAFYTVADKIAELVNVAQKISSGDLSAEISPSDKQDEIGKLQTAFFRMNKDLNALIRRIQQSVVQITTSSTQIAASGKQLEATVTEQLASTNEVTATAQQISTTAKKLVKMMDHVANMTQKTATAASDSREELGEMENTMRQLTEATTSITSKLGVMNKKASNINNVVVTITKVADQTSILSLNAAIEAEKAGEYGAGFAVVAREIRRLANQTAVATLEIEQIVKDMQSAVAMGVMEMDKFNKSVSDSVEQVNKISHQIAKVITQVQSLPPQFEQVSETMNDQSQGAQQISEAMEQLSEASQQTVDALRETNNALEQLDEAAKGLREEITHFKLQN